MFNETSLRTFRRWFIETSLAKLVVENPAILLVTNAVVATLVELSLLDGVGTDTLPFNETSPLTNIFPLNDTSLRTDKRWFIETSFTKLVVENPAILFVTKAVVATLVELSLLNGVGTETLPFIETSPLTNIFPLNDTSLRTDKRWFIETSFTKLVVENPAILFVTKAVVATLVELSLLNGVGTETLPFIETSPATNILPLKETSSLTYSLPFNDISSPIIMV